MTSIRIVNKGLLSTIQDAGRTGFQKYGMPVSGAMDQIALQTANALVGNSPFEAALECTFMGPEIEFLSAAEIAVAGADCPVSINGEAISTNTNHKLKAGDRLKIGNCKRGLRVYLAFAGGFELPRVMGSKSTYLRGKLGGYNGRALQNGDELALGEAPTFQNRQLKTTPVRLPEATNTIRIIPSSEANRFTLKGLQTFLRSEYEISSQSDRMGYRLSGPPIEHKAGADILSAGIANGTIQVPSSGEPIIMLADRQTVGGYTKIANVISVDLPLLGQMLPGEKIHFCEVSTETAQQQLRELNQQLQELVLATK